METSDQNKRGLYKGALVLIIVLSLYFAVKFLVEFRDYGINGSKEVSTIALSGHGEVNAVPDIANVYFTISKDNKTVKDAQADVVVVEKKALDLLKSKGVADKDIKTTDSSFNPKYEYRQSVCPPVPMGAGYAGITVSPASPYYCPPSDQVIVGYTANESITVKVRNVDNVGDIMQGLGATGVSNLSGPNFAIDNEDALKAEARKIAIDDAKVKAKILAKDLGVSLVKITSFSESGNYPIMYAQGMMAKDSVSSVPAPTPAVLPVGENTITSDVTITYEIR